MNKLVPIYLISFLLNLQIVYGQFIDDFNDGNFTVNPSWSGNANSYEIDTLFRLHLNAYPQTDTSYLSLPSFSVHNTTWSFLVQMDFNPSSSNFTRIYLVADESNLQGFLNGYFVMVGNTADEVSLYRQDGLAITKIIDGVDGSVNNSFVNSRVKVTRNQLGNWELLIDNNGGTTFVSEGTVLDDTYNSTSFFGVVARYTSSRSTLFFYDDFNISSTPFIDTIAPNLDSLVVIDPFHLNLYFNEPVHQNGTNYFVNSGIGTPSSSVVNGPDSSLIHLSFSNAFVNGETYTLSITGIEDTLANRTDTIKVMFDYLKIGTAQFGDIIFNELLIDPTPQVGLPAAEFIEIYNASDSIFNLNNWQLVNSSISKTIEDVNLLSKEYLILCDLNDTSLFTGFGAVMGIDGFVSLVNQEDSLTLIDNKGKIIDVVNYNISWYQNKTKEEGGWTLERINPAQTCSPLLNWVAAENILLGGTPGNQNSVLDTVLDIFSPMVDSIVVIDPNTIKVLFNEVMDSASLANSSYLITRGLDVKKVTVANSIQSVMLTVSPSILPSIYHSITITGARDCIGNPFQDNDNVFALAQVAMPKDIVINEVLFNPFSGGVDFIEIYNNSSKFIDLNQWKLANLENEIIDNHKLIISETKLLLPGEFLVLTIDTNNILQEYLNTASSIFIQMPSLPAYNNEDGDVYLINASGIVIDQFSYKESMHFALLTNYEGVSLERIDYDRETNEETNWHSAAADVWFATPGFENSQYQKDIPADEDILISPITFSPNNDGIDDVVNITYHFTETGTVANVSIYDAKGQMVRRLINNQLLGKEGTFSWDGINERNEKAAIGIYIIYFEIFDTKGIVKSYKKTAVLAGKLD